MPIETTQSGASDNDSKQEQRVRDATAAAQTAMDAARDRLSGAYTTAQEKSTQAMQGVESYVQRAPLKALGYAAAIAAVAGALLAGVIAARRNGGRRGGGSE